MLFRLGSYCYAFCKLLDLQVNYACTPFINDFFCAINWFLVDCGHCFNDGCTVASA